MLVVGLSGCLSSIPQVQRASSEGGDYTFLSCQQIEDARLSIEQRLQYLTEPAPDWFRPLYVDASTPESAVLLRSTLGDLNRQTTARKCADSSISIPRDDVLVNPPSKPLKQMLASGLYLQVAIFAQPRDSVHTIRAFRQVGLGVTTEKLNLGGRVYARILVGPLVSRGAIRKADQVASSLGLSDSFFRRR